MNRRHLALGAVSALLLVLIVAVPAAADPPDRVARLNYLRGSVSFRPASLDDWGAATINYPLTTGDRLWTDQDATAEMQLGFSVIRLAPYTAFAFLNLDDRNTQVRLSEGSIDIVVRHLETDEQFEVDTPASAVTLIEAGIYRIDVDPDGNSTKVTVRNGVAEVYSDRAEFRVYAGQTGFIDDNAGSDPRVDRADAPDAWERWCQARDERSLHSSALAHVSDEMIGYEDLDEYGTWSSIPDCGYAWHPRVVAAGWAPYRFGHWAWVDPWGWTWVDDAAWGFAPFHYGRWTSVRGDWFWVPGSWVRRPVYAPALVAFIGGDNWGISLGFGVRPAIGWFPLGPREPYLPGFRASYGYLRSVNLAHVSVTNINITTVNVRDFHYANRDVAGAVTAVPRDSFAVARSLRQVARPVSAYAVARGEVGATAAVGPRAESILGRPGAAIPRRAQAGFERAVVARSTPPAPSAPFAARERALQANAGRPLDNNRAVGSLAASDGLPVHQLRARADDARGTAQPSTRRGYAAPPPASPAGQARQRYSEPPSSTVAPGRSDTTPRTSSDARPTSSAIRPPTATPRAPGTSATPPASERPANSRYRYNEQPPVTNSTPPAATSCVAPPQSSGYGGDVRSRAVERSRPGDSRPSQVERPSAPTQAAPPSQVEHSLRARSDNPPQSSGAPAERATERSKSAQAAPKDSDKPAQAAPKNSDSKPAQAQSRGGRGGRGF